MPVAAHLDIPARLEATEPPEARGIARDRVRMLVSEREGGARDLHFTDLPRVLRAGDLVVINDSATLKAAFEARRSDGSSLRVHASARLAEHLWIVEPRARVVRGEDVALPGAGSLTFLVPRDAFAPRLWYASVQSDIGLEASLNAYGRPIRYRYVTGDYPIGAYQTMFACVPGSAEMPSAARPFTPATVDALRAADVSLASVTLHTGVSSLERHERPAPEPYRVPHATARAIEEAKRRGGRVVAIGTTVVRALESATDNAGRVVASAGWSDLIVTAKRGVRIVDALLTGFHEAQASHLDLLAAFLPPAQLERAYAHAVEAGYLWHEFGDVHLILPE